MYVEGTPEPHHCDPNPCQRPEFGSPDIFFTVLHWNNKDTNTVLAAKFVSRRTLIMACGHCCCGSCTILGREHLGGDLKCWGPCLRPGL